MLLPFIFLLHVSRGQGCRAHAQLFVGLREGGDRQQVGAFVGDGRNTGGRL